MSIFLDAVQIDLFDRNDKGEWQTGTFVGRPFHLTYTKANILVSDAWKNNANGIPQGCFLLAYYDNPNDIKTSVEAILLRVIQPTTLPTDQAVLSSMIEYYKDDIKTGEGKNSQLDEYTRYEFSFSGLECSILGCFYKDKDNVIKFGADLENFYSAHNYSVVKPSAKILEFIVNCRQGGTVGNNGDIKVGKVRYSSSQRNEIKDDPVNVYVVPTDFAGKRTALFGMTRTGKSNTVKKIIQAIVGMSDKALYKMNDGKESQDEILQPFKNGIPKYPIGQIVFDINGEYANPNLQDSGTAIFDLFKDNTIRYSTIKKDGFKVLKVNFYNEVEAGFDLVCSHPRIADDDSRFVSNFRSVSLEKPIDGDVSGQTRYQRKLVAYLCCLYRAGFAVPNNFNKIKFVASEEVRNIVNPNVNPSSGLTLEEAASWWDQFWVVYNNQYFEDYKKKNNKEWADDDLKAILAILTRKRSHGSGSTDCAGFRVLKDISNQHTSEVQDPFDLDILNSLRQGKIVIVDLSLGDEDIQRMFTERITRKIFRDSLNNFTAMKPNNFIQFYFEEAHNLFPKKDDKDLSQIYNRVAKEGAKLHLGLIYATQEVSSISSNILKATQNWFISHLNNEDEIRELRKYYDFSDFTDSLVRFSQDTDKGFVRMKTYSNAFVVPSQIDRFPN